MKKIILLLIIGCSSNAMAQPTFEQRIEDTIAGWWNKSVIAKPAPFQYLGREFSLKQQEHMNKAIEWMKKTYIPVAGIGTFRRMIYANNYSHPPHSYGVDFRVWNVSLEKKWLDEKGQFRPVPEEYTRFYFNANVIMGSYPIAFVNNPSRYLFVWMEDGYAQGEQPYRKRQNNNADPRIHPHVYKFLPWVSNLQTVYLTPNNKLPFIPVTIGEYLTMVDESIDLDKDYPDRHARMHKTVRELKEKYSSKSKEQAILSHMQPGILDYEGFSDPFELDKNIQVFKGYYPVFRIDSKTLEKCRSDQPQWIAIAFDFWTREDGIQLYELYRSLTENFNYEYVYNYFFDPEKVKGIEYKPLNIEQRDARLQAVRDRDYWKDPNGGKTLPPNVHFMDDFSSNRPGERPRGWHFRSIGEHSKISTISRFPGNWVELGFGNKISPNTSLKKPLPENFSLEFDIVTDDFQSRTGGAMEIQLDTYHIGPDGFGVPKEEGATITMRFTAGNEEDYNNNNFRGQASLKINATNDVNIENNLAGIVHEPELRDFTNRKGKIHVNLLVRNGDVKLFVNNKLISSDKDFKMHYGKNCVRCGVPPGSIFRNIQFKNITNDWGTEGRSDGVDVYLGNVKITRL